jgi:hypothetical protein
MRGIKGLRVLITTCDSYLWLLEPFAHQFNKYWSPKQEVVVGVFALPEKYGITLPDNFTIHQIQEKDIPKEERSTGFIKFFNQIDDEFFIWMLEDFWLVDDVDVDGIELLFKYMQEHPNVLRVDLTIDRVKAGKPFKELERLTLIEAPRGTRYRWSHQAAIWNKNWTLRYLRPGEGSSHEPIETHCTHRLNNDPYGPLVLGTMNWPIKYSHVIAKNRSDRHWLMLNTKIPMPVEDIKELRDLGYINTDKILPGVHRFNEGE